MSQPERCHYCNNGAVKKVYNKVITYPKYLCQACFKKTEIHTNMVVEDIKK